MAGKITGLGGVFFKSENPKATKEWYNQHLGLNTNEYGATFEWLADAETLKKGTTVWSPFSKTTKYMEPSEKDFMINFRVDDLESLLEELKKNGIMPIGDMQVYDYGKFAHIIDPDGVKIELWEPMGE